MLVIQETQETLAILETLAVELEEVAAQTIFAVAGLLCRRM